MTAVRSLLSTSFLLLLILTTLTIDTFAQAPAGGRFVMKTIQDDTGTYPYQVFLPRGYTPSRKWPVIVFLHGAGERGVDGKLQTTIGLGPFLESGVVDPGAVVVFPQAPKLRGRLLDHWAPTSKPAERMFAILRQVEADYSIDNTKRVLTGWSMGGYGVWSIAAASPDMWSALVPIAGGGDVSMAASLKSIPAWSFHGTDDQLVPVARAHEMTDAVKNAGGSAALTVFPKVGHDSWLVAYANPALYQWMKNPKTVPEDLVDGDRYRAGNVSLPFGSYGTQPFTPGMTISKAASVMISPSMIAYLSRTLTEQMQQRPFSGPVQAISTTTSAEGYSFDVTFSGNSYVANVSKIDVIANGDGTMTANIGLSPIRMTLGRTSIRGVRRQAASTGPISIVVGHRYPVNLSLRVRPQVNNGRFAFQFVAADFDIPADNFSVSTPVVTGTSGWGVTSERVGSGIVSGLYGSRGRMEQEVRRVAPTLVRTFEETINSSLDFSQGEDVLAGMWPMPFYQPRARIFPEAVDVNGNGIAIRLGVVSGKLAGADQSKPIVATIQGAKSPSMGSLGDEELLRVNIDTGLFEAFNRQIIESDLNEVHVKDVPVESFYEFANAEYWSSLSEEMKKAFEGKGCEAYLRLVDPVMVKPNANSAEYQIGTKGLMLDVYSTEQGKETLVTSLRIDLAQSLKLDVADTPTRGNELTMQWIGDPVLKISTEKGEIKLDDAQVAQIQDRFKTGWNDWIDHDKMVQLKSPTVPIGLARLTMTRLSTDNVNLQASFGPGKIRLINKSDEPLDYRIATKVSPWSDFSLPGGRNHAFTTLYPYKFSRKVDGRDVEFTLPVGGVYEYRSPASGGAPQLFMAN
ncbi:carboxylesterase family protein [Lacunimicrobium album]